MPTRFRNFETYCYMDGTFGTVLDSSNCSFEIDLDGFNDGIIDCWNMASDSTDFTISLFSEDGSDVDTIKERIRVENVNLAAGFTNLGMFFRNTDEPTQNKIYAKVVNDDVARPTGIINWSMGILIHRKIVKGRV